MLKHQDFLALELSSWAQLLTKKILIIIELFSWQPPNPDPFIVLPGGDVWRSAAIDSAESWHPLCTMCLSIWWSSSVILRGLLVSGCHFYNSTDYWIFSRDKISQLVCAHAASNHSTTQEFTELLRETHSFTNGCESSLHAMPLTRGQRSYGHRWW